MGEVATTKLLENDRVILWEMVLEPGERTGVHTHHHNYIIQVLEGSQLRATDANGEGAIDLDFRTDDTYWVEVKDDKVVFGSASAPATHDAQNIGSGRYRELLIEIK